ncbi:HAMP domain-containing sensor histidine kinase [Clostridium oryzae]|uniref:histidine kinase n=1 Tax=Clostridium oryzae TaxID=1450648 RepID=A0A1V4IJG2_9CLOT|nr:HAMP domain-containing sensor histidine kinase [Clostridium oryzae]OPJ59865.1 sensor histidine kinase CssS [Clostridium oryzae]
MEQMKKTLNNLSLKKSLIAIVLVTIIFVIGLSAITIFGCSIVQNETLKSRSIVIHKYKIIDRNTGEIRISSKDYQFEKLTTYQNIIYSIANIGNLIFPVLYVIIGVVFAASVFYRVKLKEPIYILNESAIKVGKNDLDFFIDYKNNDEMGKLCDAFEKMRTELYRNNKAMWKMIDERKQLNAAAAHDLRTPITVIKGYTQYLQKNIPKGKISSEKLCETLSNVLAAANRLENYVDSVRDIERLEQVELARQYFLLSKLLKEAKEYLSVLAERFGKEIIFTYVHNDMEVFIDKQMLFRILENIATNGLRYAKFSIHIECFVEKEFLYFQFIDDGKGLSQEELKSAYYPFYTDKQRDDHLGMGLAICKILCHKHGGELILANEKGMGAKVTAKICVR